MNDENISADHRRGLALPKSDCIDHDCEIIITMCGARRSSFFAMTSDTHLYMAKINLQYQLHFSVSGVSGAYQPRSGAYGDCLTNNCMSRFIKSMID